MQRRRVSEEVFRYVKLDQQGRKQTAPDEEEAPANYVLAAAVIRRGQALSSELLGVKGA